MEAATARDTRERYGGTVDRYGVDGPGFGATGAEVMAYAADILPSVAGALPGPAAVDRALREAPSRLGAGADGRDPSRLADEVRDMFAAYLVVAGKVAPQPRAAGTVRGWVVFHDRAGIQRALSGAAEHWRLALAPDAPAPTALRDRALVLVLP